MYIYIYYLYMVTIASQNRDKVHGYYEILLSSLTIGFLSKAIPDGT